MTPAADDALGDGVRVRGSRSLVRDLPTERRAAARSAAGEVGAVTPFVLTGALVRLEPMTLAHSADLVAAASIDRSGYAFTRVPDGPVEADRYVLDALDDQRAGRSLAWVVRRLVDGGPGPVVGSTRYLDMQVLDAHAQRPTDARPPSVLEIGHTWYAASVQRTGVNTEAKLLLLTHAFDGWGALRVSLKTDARNTRSRSAIERLGAVAEGIRRAHAVASDSTVRDTAYYSVVRSEWPAVKAFLAGRLGVGARTTS